MEMVLGNVSSVTLTPSQCQRSNNVFSCKLIAFLQTDIATV